MVGVERRVLAGPSLTRQRPAAAAAAVPARPATQLDDGRWLSISFFTLASGRTLSTPWPCAHHVDELVAVAQHDLAAR